MLIRIVQILFFIHNAQALIISNISTEAALTKTVGKFWEPPINNETELSSTRKGKSWWFDGGLPFGLTSGVVLIENGLCTGSNNLLGLCYTIKQCRRLNGGFAAGFCAQKYGRCCVTQLSCGATSNSNNTYFQSPPFPAAYSGGPKCGLTVQKCDNTMCQVRITFVRLILAPPVGGVCSNDALTITGGAGNPIVVCGDMTGQHVYMDFNNADNIVLTIETNSAVAFNRYWQIQVAQITCDSITRAPSGCLQYYYDGTTGTVSSFDFGTTLQDPISTSRQLRNLRYGICVARQPGYCSIAWTSPTASTFIVSETGGVPNLIQTGATCTDNYVIIPGSPAWRYCGSGFPTSVTTNSQPFVLYYVTSALVGGGTIGFSLTWTQNVCDNSIIF